MEVSSSTSKFRIELIDLSLLRPHEEVIDQLIQKLSSEIESEGEVRDPLIIDDKNYVVLDGMHRYNSLKKLECRFAPCCLLDYDSPEVRVESWFRVAKVGDSEKFARRILAESDLKCTESRISFDKGNCGSAIILAGSGTAFSPSVPVSDVEHARIALRLEKTISGKGLNVEYQPSRVAIEKLRASDVDIIIPLPMFTKQRIRELGTQGMLLPHKVTCHIIPSRPLRVDVPLTLLRNRGLSISEANEELTRILAAKKIDKKPPGSSVDGRLYAEELLVFH